MPVVFTVFTDYKGENGHFLSHTAPQLEQTRGQCPAARVCSSSPQAISTFMPADRLRVLAMGFAAANLPQG
jgi:hypothetical protein